MSDTVTANAVNTPIEPVYDKLNDIIERPFYFRSIDKLGEDNKPIWVEKDGKKEKVKIKRPEVVLKLKRPSLEGIAAILTSGSEADQRLLLDAVEAVIADQARTILSEDDAWAIKGDATFPHEQTAWSYIAKQPRGTRRGGGIPKEAWESFSDDYRVVMQEIADLSEQGATRQANVLAKRLVPVKSNRSVLELLQTMVATYAEQAPNAEQYSEIIEFLEGRFEEYLNVSEEEALAGLM